MSEIFLSFGFLPKALDINLSALVQTKHSVLTRRPSRKPDHHTPLSAEPLEALELGSKAEL